MSAGNGAAPAADPRHEAVAAWRASVQAGEPLTGRDLGDRFNRSPRWGRDRIAEARTGDPDGLEPAETPAVAPAAASPSLALHRTRVAATVVVALVAAAVSFDHQRQLAQIAGEGWRSWLLPLSVDGMLVVASVTALERRRAGRPAGWLAAISGLLGIAASVAANVAAVTPDLDGDVWAPWVAAWAPIALLLSVEMLLSHRPTAGGSDR